MTKYTDPDLTEMYHRGLEGKSNLNAQPGSRRHTAWKDGRIERKRLKEAGALIGDKNLITITAEAVAHWHGVEGGRALVVAEVARLAAEMEPPEDPDDSDEAGDLVKLESHEAIEAALTNMVWEGQKVGFVHDFWQEVLKEIK